MVMKVNAVQLVGERDDFFPLKLNASMFCLNGIVEAGIVWC